MKKIISLGIASAICAITAISASAAPAYYDNATGEVTTDGVITVDVKAGEEIKDGIAFKIETEGLEVQDAKNPGSYTLNQYVAANQTFMVSGGESFDLKAGDVICTITAKVTAKAGEQISISLIDNTGVYTSVLPDIAYTDTVKGAETSDTSSDTSTSETSSDTSTDTSDTEKDPDKSPATGVALAVVPAVLAAAGVVVAKKRK